MLSSFPDQTHANDTIELAEEGTAPAHNDALPTFQSPQDVDEDEPITRYIVKYKAGSQELKLRMQQASVLATQQTNIRGGSATNTTPTSRDSQLLTFGSFLPKDNAEVVYISSEKEVQAWEEKDDVEYVELDTKVYLQGEETPYGITNVHALDVPDTDVSNRKVCIIDSGYDITHPDLTSDPNVVTGYEGDLSAGSWDYDGHGHGTHVAGTIAAIGGNDEGVFGVTRNGQVKLHIVKVFNDDGNWAWGSNLIAAVEECVDSGSNIVNMSLGGKTYSQTANDAYRRIFNEDNVLLVAAAGNAGDTSHLYPASYRHVMSVAATDSNNNLAYFSQRNDQVDIAAPGKYVLSTLPSHVDSSGYAAWSGTSMATPHVSGVAALIWSLDTSKSAVEIKGILEASAEDLGEAGRDDSYGHGLVRADRARDIMDTFTILPTISPSPTVQPTPASCRDDPEGWYSNIGPLILKCEWYAQGSNCEIYGDSFENFGKTANEACCACGGGKKAPTVSPSPSVSPTNVPTSPTVSPTNAPTLSPTASPTNAPTTSPKKCPSGKALLRVKVITDRRPGENRFVVKKKNILGNFGWKVWEKKNDYSFYFRSGTTYNFEKCLEKDECYKLFMFDKGGDGMCCENGKGGFKASWKNSVIIDTFDGPKFKDGDVKKVRFGKCS